MPAVPGFLIITAATAGKPVCPRLLPKGAARICTSFGSTRSRLSPKAAVTHSEVDFSLSRPDNLVPGTAEEVVDGLGPLGIECLIDNTRLVLWLIV